LTSGKLKEFIELFVRKLEPAAGGWNQRRVEAEPPPRTSGLVLLDGVFNTGEDELAGRTALSGSDLMEPPMKIPRQIDGGSDGTRLHTCIFAPRLK
jgi:hypothetical protein